MCHVGGAGRVDSMAYVTFTLDTNSYVEYLRYIVRYITIRTQN